MRLFRTRRNACLCCSAFLGDNELSVSGIALADSGKPTPWLQRVQSSNRSPGLFRKINGVASPKQSVLAQTGCRNFHIHGADADFLASKFRKACCRPLCKVQKRNRTVELCRFCTNSVGNLRVQTCVKAFAASSSRKKSQTRDTALVIG